MQMQFQNPETDPIPSFMLTNELDYLPWLWEPFWSTPLGLFLTLAVPTAIFMGIRDLDVPGTRGRGLRGHHDLGHSRRLVLHGL